MFEIRFFYKWPKNAIMIPIFVPMMFTRATLSWVHCVPKDGGRVQRLESKCWGVLGTPLLGNKKSFLAFDFGFMFFCSQKIFWYILPNFHFMVFDRYEIPIQDFEDLFARIFIIFRCPSFRKMPVLRVSEISTFMNK